MPKYIDDEYIQKRCIAYIACELGEDMVDSAKGSGKRTRLTSVSIAARNAICGTVNDRTVREWWQFFLEFGYTPAEARALSRKYKKTKRYSTNWTDDTYRLLKSIVDDKGELYLDEIQEELHRLGGGWWSPSTISTKLRSNIIKYSLQVATDVASQKDVQEQEEFLEAIRSRNIHPRQLIFVDESNKDANSARRRRSWSKRGLTPMRRVYFEGDRGKRYTLIAATDINGFMYESCQIVFQATPNDKDPTHGTIDSARFQMWVKEKLVPYLGNYYLGEPRSVVIMDNATIHAGVKELIEGAGAKLIYLSAYSPELNPIELMFGMYKAYLKRHRDEELSTAHSNALRCVSPEIARALFKHSRVPGCEHFLSHAELKLQEQQNTIVAASVACSSHAVLMMAMIEEEEEDDDDDEEEEDP